MPKKIGDLTLYSVDDLHETLGLSKMTLRTYFREGKLKGRKLGVSWYITEEALRAYFKEPHENDADPKEGASAAPRTKRRYRYVIEGVNDLVSERIEAATIEEAVEAINAQAIISLFQVAIIDQQSDEVIELVKARDFLERNQ